MVNKKIIILLSSLFVLDKCIYASEGDKSDYKISKKRSRSSDSSGSDSDESSYLDSGSSESEVLEDEIDWEETPDMRLLSGIIERNSISILAALKDGANPNFIYKPKNQPVDPQGYEYIPMLEVALTLNCSFDILRALIKDGASLDIFKNRLTPMDSFLRQAGEKTTEDALFVLNKILESGVQVRPSCMGSFLIDCAGTESCNKDRERFISTLLIANPSCASQSSLNSMCSRRIRPGLRHDYRSHEDCFSIDAFDSDCRILANTLRSGGLNSRCFRPQAEQNALNALRLRIKIGEQDSLKSCPKTPALFSLLFARLCHNPKGGELGSSAEVIKQFEDSCNSHKSLKILPTDLRLPASRAMLRLKCLSEASSRMSCKIVAGEMQLAVSGDSSALKRSLFGMDCAALLVNKDFEKIYELMLRQDLDSSSYDKINKLLLLQCGKCLGSRGFSPIEYLVANGRCLNLLEEDSSVGGAACGDSSRVAVANSGRLPVQAVGGAANRFSLKRNLVPEDNLLKVKIRKKEDQAPK